MKIKINRIIVKLKRNAAGRTLIILWPFFLPVTLFIICCTTRDTIQTPKAMLAFWANFGLYCIAMKALGRNYAWYCGLKKSRKLIVKYRGMSNSMLSTMIEQRDQVRELTDMINKTKYN